MPSRAVAAKVILCATASTSPVRPGTASPRIVATQPRGFQAATLPALNLTSTTTASRTVNRRSPSTFFDSPCRHHHHSTSMDPTLEKLLSSNAQWLAAVNDSVPNFFESSAKGQSPKVRGGALLTVLTFMCMRADPLAWMFRLARP